MTLELKQYPNFAYSAPKAYRLGGVKKITSQTEYGEGNFAITIFDRRVFVTDYFEFVRDPDSGKYYVKDGKWVGENG